MFQHLLTVPFYLYVYSKAVFSEKEVFFAFKKIDGKRDVFCFSNSTVWQLAHSLTEQAT